MYFYDLTSQVVKTTGKAIVTLNLFTCQMVKSLSYINKCLLARLFSFACPGHHSDTAGGLTSPVVSWDMTCGLHYTTDPRICAPSWGSFLDNQGFISCSRVHTCLACQGSEMSKGWSTILMVSFRGREQSTRTDIHTKLTKLTDFLQLGSILNLFWFCVKF